MAKSRASAAEHGDELIWPPPEVDLADTFDADPPTQPIHLDALPIHRNRIPVTSAPVPALPTAGEHEELEWPPSAESIARIAVVSVETGAEHTIDPDTGTAVPAVRSTAAGAPARIAVASTLGTAAADAAADAAHPPSAPPAPARVRVASKGAPRIATTPAAVGARSRRVPIAAAALVVLIAPPSIAVWSLASRPALPPVQPPALFAPREPLLPSVSPAASAAEVVRLAAESSAYALPSPDPGVPADAADPGLAPVGEVGGAATGADPAPPAVAPQPDVAPAPTSVGASVPVLAPAQAPAAVPPRP